MAQKPEAARLDSLISHSDNLDEELSVQEFIKTLKKADSVTDSVNSKTGETTSANPQEVADDKRKLSSAEKRSSASELLSNMRRRFVHRATEPVFSQLEQGKGAQGYQEVGRAGSGRGSEYQLRGLNFETCTTILERKTDSEPALGSPSTSNWSKNKR